MNAKPVSFTGGTEPSEIVAPRETDEAIIKNNGGDTFWLFGEIVEGTYTGNDLEDEGLRDVVYDPTDVGFPLDPGDALTVHFRGEEGLYANGSYGFEYDARVIV